MLHRLEEVENEIEILKPKVNINRKDFKERALRMKALYKERAHLLKLVREANQ